jgi:hypothetical protein
MKRGVGSQIGPDGDTILAVPPAFERSSLFVYQQAHLYTTSTNVRSILWK